jgi:hypothetical protein
LSRCEHSRRKHKSEKESPAAVPGFPRYHSPVVIFARISVAREKVKRGKTGATKWQ